MKLKQHNPIKNSLTKINVSSILDLIDHDNNSSPT